MWESLEASESCRTRGSAISFSTFSASFPFSPTSVPVEFFSFDQNRFLTLWPDSTMGNVHPPL